MSSPSETPESSLQFKLILDTALSEYKQTTGNDLLHNWLAKELQSCESVEAVLNIITHQAEAFDKFRGGDKRLMKWIDSSVNVLYTISATLGEGVGMALPSAKVVFTGIGVLLAAAKDVRASHDALVDLFQRIQFFLKRLGVHTQISPTNDMVEILVKIVAEVLSILSIATKEMQRCRLGIYLNKLVGRTDIEDALKRLDSLTQEEVRMAIAQILKAMAELKDGAKKAKEAAEQIAINVGELKDNLDETKDNLDGIKDDIDEIKDDVVEIMDDVGEIKGNLDEIKDGVNEVKWDQIEQHIRNWFASPDPSTNYNIACDIHQDGTAAWLFEGGIFKEWELVGSLLWIHGKPGSGKSILSSAIIKHVISLRDAGHASLAYFYFDFRDEDKKNLRKFLTSLLTQLSAYSNPYQDPCREIISGIYSTHGKGTQQPSTGALTKCLHDMLSAAAQQPIYIVIDALDECPDITGFPTPRAVVLNFLEDLVELNVPNLHICVTSRPEADIKIVLEPLAYISVSLHDEAGQNKDISDYVCNVVYSDRKMRKWRDEDKNRVVEVLSEKADGMFRWVFCQLAELQHCLPSSIRQTLDHLPESLDETYARVLSQIPQANQAQAHRVLQCLLVAVRPLRVEELAEVLAFEFTTVQGAIPRYRADWRSNDQEQAVLSTCSSLIAIVGDHGSKVVQFMHFSVKEFLTSGRLGAFSRYHILPAPAHTVLAQACLGFLLHLDCHVNEKSVTGFPLAEYAARNWITHAQFEDVASHVKGGMEFLFDGNKPHFAAWVGIYNVDKESYWNSPSEIPTPLYYSSLCGFCNLVEHLAIKFPRHVNAIGGRYKYPLFAALGRKRARVAEILLNHGADINCRQDDLCTPLHLATRDRNLEVARVLLEHRPDVDSRDRWGKTPLKLLVESEYCEDDDALSILRLLLEHGVDANRRDKDNKPLLRLETGESVRECDDVSGPARLPLEYDADADTRTDKEWTLLHSAAFHGRFKIARVLLDHGANANAENNQGQTPLYLASLGIKEHSVDIARLLLERGADVNAPNKDNNTPLHLASSFVRGLEITRVLLKRGANTNAENDQGMTPLHLVSRGKYHSLEHGTCVARMLLDRGAGVNALDQDYDTPLHSASYLGIPMIAKVLLEHGADVDMVNKRGETPLHLVSRGKYRSHEDGVNVARMLLERGADVNFPSQDHGTPLHFASYFGSPAVARVLIDHGADVNAENDQGQTPLYLASRSIQAQSVDVARLLLECGARVNAPNKDHNTPLHSASYFGIPTVAKVLLEHGADVDTVNKQRKTPLHLVSRGKYHSHEDGVGVARVLLERGADINALDQEHGTPLHSSSYFGTSTIARVLLDHGADVNAVDDQGRTPLYLASRGIQGLSVDVARLLLECGAHVNAPNKDHNTPLHSASYFGVSTITSILLDYGADLNAENKHGDTPLHLVSRGKYHSHEDGVGVARILLERGVDVNAQDQDHDTPLHAASYFGRFEIARVLLDHSANVNAGNKQGETPLHLVSRSKHDDSHEHGIGIAKLLLEHGADRNARDKNNATPLRVARDCGRLDIAGVLGKN